MTLTLTLIRVDPREQPRCTNCLHRRIAHFKATGDRTKQLTETATLCGVNVDGYPCGCAQYVPKTR